MSQEILNKTFSFTTSGDSNFGKKLWYRVVVELNSQDKSTRTSNITLKVYNWYLWNESGTSSKKWGSAYVPTQRLYLGSEVKHTTTTTTKYQLPSGYSSNNGYGYACNPAVEQLTQSWTGNVSHSSDGTYSNEIKVTFDKSTDWTSTGQPYLCTPPSGSTTVGMSGLDLTFELPAIAASAPSVKVNGEWKDGDECFVKVNGEWKVADTCYVKIDGVWKEIV